MAATPALQDVTSQRLWIYFKTRMTLSTLPKWGNLFQDASCIPHAEEYHVVAIVVSLSGLNPGSNLDPVQCYFPKRNKPA